MTTNQDTVLYTAPLYINTDYILLVGSNTPGCALDVRLEGRSVSIDACCAAAIDYGETVNVEVKGSDPTLGFVWTPEELAQMVDNQLATLSPYETTTFEVTGFVEGCSYTDAVLVAVGSPMRCPTRSPPTTMTSTTPSTSTACRNLSSRPSRFSTVGDNRSSGRFRTPTLGTDVPRPRRARRDVLLRHQPERTQRQPRPHHGACRRDPMKKSMYLHMVLACAPRWGAATASAQFNGVRTQFLMTSLLDNPAAAGNSACLDLRMGTQPMAGFDGAPRTSFAS